MKTAPAPQIAFDDFLKVDIRVGRVVAAEPFPEARKPAYRLTIDFGPAIGIKKSSAQITKNHRLEDLPGRLVLAVVNLPARQIGPARSRRRWPDHLRAVPSGGGRETREVRRSCGSRRDHAVASGFADRAEETFMRRPRAHEEKQLRVGRGEDEGVLLAPRCKEE